MYICMGACMNACKCASVCACARMCRRRTAIVHTRARFGRRIASATFMYALASKVS